MFCCHDIYLAVHPANITQCCAAPQSSTEVTEFSAEVEVFLVNGKSVKVEVGAFDRTDQVLEKVASEIQLPPKLTYYFGLFLEKEDEETGTWTGSWPRWYSESEPLG